MLIRVGATDGRNIVRLAADGEHVGQTLRCCCGGSSIGVREDKVNEIQSSQRKILKHYIKAS